MNRAGLPAGVSSSRSQALPMRLVLLALLAVLIAGCASTPPRPDTYTVRRGDTLYSISWRHGLNYKDVARWNGIGSSYTIYPGQRLRLYPPSGAASARTASRPAATPPAPRTASPPASGRTRPATPVRPPGPPVAWQWPVTGGTATLTSRPNGGHGLTIAGRQGSEIRAAGPGRVVYSGTGLLGYGQLLIIKHNDTYLSAYGHLQSVQVSEGADVNAGQRIATMGQGPQGTPMLYFEIRVQGSPSNPLALLPQR